MSKRFDYLTLAMHIVDGLRREFEGGEDKREEFAAEEALYRLKHIRDNTRGCVEEDCCICEWAHMILPNVD